MQDTLSYLSVSDFGSWSAEPGRPDYACDAYRTQLPRWKLVKDLRGGTVAIRQHRETYLPKFDAESANDWNSRVAQTFVNEWYGETLDEHVGLVFSETLKLGDDVPQPIVDLCEDLDGEGSHIEVFAQNALDKACHWGHGVIMTEYPNADKIITKQDEQRIGARPYAVLYEAPDVLSWRTAVIGGKQVIVQLMLREHSDERTTGFGTRTCVRYREWVQDLTIDPVTERVTGTGDVRWNVYEKDDNAGAEAAPVLKESGVAVGPGGKMLIRIPCRVVYGGQKLGTLETKPHLMGIAYSNIEETQVTSDYAAVMHKCNVPSPYFINRVGAGDGVAIKLGEGIDIGLGGSAGFLEPTGVALEATRSRLKDIQERIRNQGATSSREGDSVNTRSMTAAQARMIAKTRNAKLRKAARSLQDALEGVLADFAMYMGLAAPTGTVKSGGSVVVNQNFVGDDVDPAYLQVLVQAFVAGAFPLEALLYALKTGSLPDEFSAEQEALKLVAAAAAQAKADAQLAKDTAAAAAKAGQPPPPPKA